MLASNSFINKCVYIIKSQFLFISEMLKMKLSLKFGKIIRNRLRNSAVNVEIIMRSNKLQLKFPMFEPTELYLHSLYLCSATSLLDFNI